MGVEEVRSTIMELQNGIDEKLDKFEQKIEKKLTEMENVIIKKCNEHYMDKLRSVKQAMLETIREEKEELKEEVTKSLENGLFVLKKIDGGGVQEDVEGPSKTPEQEIAPCRREQEGIPKQVTPRIPKVSWKDFPMQDHFLRKEHEKLGWKKNNSVKKSIFDSGVKRKLWNDDEVWRKRISYKIDAQYKANYLMSDTRSSPS